MFILLTPNGKRIEYQSKEDMIERLENMEDLPLHIISDVKIQNQVKLLKEDKIIVESFIENLEPYNFLITEEKENHDDKI